VRVATFIFRFATGPRNRQAIRTFPHLAWSIDMLGIIAAVLIVCWLLGFFVLHVSSFLIHILLVVGLIMIVMHLLRGRSGSA
jgi:hypothetical protein